jgi:hypothetical protein
MNVTIKKYLSSIAIVFCLGSTLTGCGDKTAESNANAKPEATPKTETIPKTETTVTPDDKGKDSSKMDDSESTSRNAKKDDKEDKGKDENKKKRIEEIEKKNLGVLPTNETDCPKNAPVKGRISKKHGEVYHLAQSENYNSLKPDICFSTKENAEKAGFKAPKAAN